MKAMIGRWAAGVVLGAAVAACGDEFADVAKKHPAAAEIEGLFKGTPDGFKPTGLARKDYLPVIAGVVDYWKHFQNADGAIVDPYEKKERQYSTPAFALASAILVQEAGRKDLLEPSARAMTCAMTALANKKAADGHADFYIPMLMHAHRILVKQPVAKETAEDWDKKLRSLVPEKIYHDPNGGGNWNIVNVSGELLRRKDGLVEPGQMDAQMAYVEKCLGRQQRVFTKYGMYHDANAPLAYDAFPRLWLEDTFADGAYEGQYAQKVNEWLRLGGISSLMLLSPSGEWACGGRSGQHQWNEAENAVIAECNADYWKKHGNDAVAGAFKRAARLCLESMKRWVRPSGEFWIVKNFADPARRFGYEGYSFNSQYNLLPAAMLAIAYERADDSIAETPKPGEADAYLFDLRETFHKVVAGADGNYVEIETAADPHYDSTGLQRVHRAGVALSPLSESVPAHRGYGPEDEPREGGFTPGIQWRETDGGEWRGLGDYVSGKDGADPKHPPTAVAQDAALKPGERGGKDVSFTLAYSLKGAGARPVTESYRVTGPSVEVTSKVDGDVAATRVVLPVLLSDGVRMTQVKLDGATARVERAGGTLTYEVVEPAGVKLHLDGPKFPMHNGYVQAAVGDLPADAKEVRWRVTLEAEGAARK